MASPRSRRQHHLHQHEIQPRRRSPHQDKISHVAELGQPLGYVRLAVMTIPTAAVLVQKACPAQCGTGRPGTSPRPTSGSMRSACRPPCTDVPGRLPCGIRRRTARCRFSNLERHRSPSGPRGNAAVSRCPRICEWSPQRSGARSDLSHPWTVVPIVRWRGAVGQPTVGRN